MKQTLYSIFKRSLDIFISLIATIILFPFFIVISFIIKLTDKGPVFFVQKRPGKNGKIFKIYKFRTMYINSDEILKDYLNKNSEARKEWGNYRKLKGYDPRVTPIGKILRKFSLDEIPQFFNVLKGDMSIVGPRPYILEEFKDYNVDKKIIDKILSVKPGITGFWQVSKRNESYFLERINMDLEYIDKKNIFMDIKIIFKTISVVLLGKGAY